MAMQGSLYNLIGYCVHSIKNNKNICDQCLREVVAAPSQAPHPASELTAIKKI